MCGRYRLHRRDARQLAIEYGIDPATVEPDMLIERLNVRPTENVLSISIRDQSRQPEMLKWGVAFAASERNGVKVPARLIVNARDDKLADSRLWRPMFDTGRVLIPATGFYEWSGPKGARQAHAFEPEETFALGGISRLAKDGTTEAVVVTTTPNAQVEPVHNRMPVMLGVDDFDAWLDGDSGEASQLLRPWPKAMAETVFEVGAI